LRKETYEKLEHLRALLGHAVPSGDMDAVLGRAFDLAIAAIERQKFGVGSRTRAGSHRSSSDPRQIPAAVRSEVFRRDEGRCTFVSESGQRCESRTRLELDHVTPIARGGESTAANLRLRCRVHNQHEAECTFGAGFMERKRQHARRRPAAHADTLRVRHAAQEREVAVAAAEGVRNADVIPWLRRLGVSAEAARRGAASCGARDDAPIEARVRAALDALAAGSPAHTTR
jgi:5-methylcytosine-specific restriction endonuclease McrA